MNKKCEFKGNILEDFKKAVRYWAENNPAKNTPLFAMNIESELLTPLQIAEHVEQETVTGKEFIAFIEMGATAGQQTEEQVITRFRRLPPQP